MERGDGPADMPQAETREIRIGDEGDRNALVLRLARQLAEQRSAYEYEHGRLTVRIDALLFALVLAQAHAKLAQDALATSCAPSTRAVTSWRWHRDAKQGVVPRRRLRHGSRV